MTINQSLKKTIDRIKFEFSLNQAQIAERIGVKSTYLSDMINGRVAFNESFKNKIYEEFHIDFNEENSYSVSSESKNWDALIRLTESQQRTIESLSKTIENLTSKQ